MDNRRCQVYYPGITPLIGDQSDRRDLEAIISKIGTPDIIIDDGGHMMGQQQVSLGYLFRHLKAGGLYVIEDLLTSYSEGTSFNPTGTPHTTLKILQRMQAGEDFESEFMTRPEIEYLREQAEFVAIEKGARSEIAFIKKKASAA